MSDDEAKDPTEVDAGGLTEGQRSAFEKVFAEMAGVSRDQLAEWLAENYMLDLDSAPEIKAIVERVYAGRPVIQRDDFVELACEVLEKVM